MFITFEGLDFSGKSTQVCLLEDYLVKNKKNVKIIREPGGTVISEKVREILLDKQHNEMYDETEFLLFSSARAQLVREVIRPALAAGYYVISDRFHDSSIAYQGFGREIMLDYIQKISAFAIGATIPDITFFIDLPVEEASKRKALRNCEELDRIELSKNNFYERVRKGYLYLAKNEPRFIVVNGLLPIQEIHEKIISEIQLLEMKGVGS